MIWRGVSAARVTPLAIHKARSAVRILTPNPNRTPDPTPDRRLRLGLGLRRGRRMGETMDLRKKRGAGPKAFRNPPLQPIKQKGLGHRANGAGGRYFFLVVAV